MKSTEQQEREQKAAALVAQILPKLREVLTAPWEEKDEGKFIYPGWASRGGWGDVRLYPAMSRFGHYMTGNTVLELAGYRPVGSNSLPQKQWEFAPRDIAIELPKALALIKKRAALVAEDQAKRAAADADEKDYEARLKAAVIAAHFPDNCWEESRYEKGKREFTGGTPILVGIPETLQISVSDRWYVTAEQAAQIFTIVGGKLELKIVSDLTPEQFIALRGVIGPKEGR